MFRSAEIAIDVGIPIKPIGLMQNRDLWGSPVTIEVDTGSQRIPFELYCKDFYIEGRKVRGVNGIDAHANPYELRQYGLATMTREVSYSEVEYELAPKVSEYFKRLALRVRLPDVEGCLTSYPWRYDLVHNKSIGFRFFGQPQDMQLPLIAGGNPLELQHLKKITPALVLPPRTWPLLEEEKGRGFLAIKPGDDYQREIEVQFDLLDPGQVRKIELGNTVVIPKGWENEGPWAGADWSEIFGNLSFTELQGFYAKLSESLAKQTASDGEIEYMRELLLESKNPTDTRTAAEHLFMLKASHLRWIEKELRNRCTGRG